MQSECSAKRSGGISAQDIADEVYVRGDGKEYYDYNEYEDDYDYAASASRGIDTFKNFYDRRLSLII